MARRAVITLIALALATVAGELVLQVMMAVTVEQIHYIPVFLLLPVFALIVSAPFLVAQFRERPLDAVNKTAKWTAGGFIALAVVLIALALRAPGSFAAEVRKVLAWAPPGLTVILTHWLVIGFGLRGPASQSGGTQP